MAEKTNKNDMPGKTPRGKKIWRRVVLGIFIGILLLFGTASVFIFRELSLIRKADPQTAETVPPEEEHFEADADPSEDTVSPDEIEWEKPAETGNRKNQKVHNILLIGQDRRPGEGRARSDSMILCSINEDTDKITLISLMRDMYVPIPGYSDNRINAAYAFGGMELLDRVIEQDFGVSVDGNVEVDFDGFLQVMAAAAPLEIELNAVEAAYLNGTAGGSFSAGVNALNEEQLLVYSRVRSIGHADYERTDRQRKVLTAAFQKLRQRPVTELFTTAESVLPYLTTDLSSAEILNLIFIVTSQKMTIGESCRIPAEGTYTPQMIRGMSVLVPDLTANSEALNDYICGKE